MKRFATALLPLGLASCVDIVIPVAAAGVALDPVEFFTGRSEGEGTLHTFFGSTTPIRVRSVGRADGQGGLVLVQTIQQGDKAPRRRSWTFRPNGPGNYTGALTDADGPVDLEVEKGKAIINYTMKNGMQVFQILALQQDGRTIRNSLHVYKFGVPIARLDETIRKLD